MPTFKQLTEQEIEAIRPKPPRDEYVEAIQNVLEDGSGYLEVVPDPGQTPRSVMSNINKAAKKLGVEVVNLTKEWKLGDRVVFQIMSQENRDERTGNTDNS
jgi:hypothetical protein